MKPSAPPPSKRAVIYARVSSKEQEKEGYSIPAQLKLLKAPAGALVGRHPADLDVRARTGCSVVAVERGDSLLTNFEPDFRFAAEDAVFICGSQQGVERFQADYGV